MVVWSHGLYPCAARFTRLVRGYVRRMELLRVIRSAMPSLRLGDDTGISAVGIVLALAAIGLIVVAAIVAFVIPN